MGHRHQLHEGVEAAGTGRAMRDGGQRYGYLRRAERLAQFGAVSGWYEWRGVQHNYADVGDAAGKGDKPRMYYFLNPTLYSASFSSRCLLLLMDSQARQPWEKQLAAVVQQTQRRGRWNSIVVGGCCRAKPEDIRRLRAAVIPTPHADHRASAIPTQDSDDDRTGENDRHAPGGSAN